jgi:pimeloyl-ACP methyl ester carboxylesterase
MLDERAYIAQVEAASPETFSEMLSTADQEQQNALRAYFGAAKLDRLRTLAQRQLVRGPGAKKGNLVLLPGILGSELTVGTTQLEKVWFGLWSILKGDFDQLQLDSSGKSIKAVNPSAALRRYYGELEQSLLAEWNVLVFPYDWRLDIRSSADLLVDKINAQFGSANGVHLVAHSMGGLVSRSLAQRHPDEWARMGKLVMIGTPNYGSLSIAHLYTGLYRLMRILAAVDRQHNLADLLQLAKNFVGTYQMLPRTDKLAGTSTAAKLYDPATYGDLHPLRDRLDDAQEFQADLDVIHNPERLTYIAGANQPTADGVSDWSRLGSMDAYTFTRMGDGTVPHSLGLLPGIAATYFVEEEHGALPSNQIVMEAVGRILSDMVVEGVATQPPAPTRGPGEDLAAIKAAEDDRAVAEAEALRMRLMSMRGSYDSATVAPEEQQIADLAIMGKVTDDATLSTRIATTTTPGAPPPSSVATATNATVGDPTGSSVADADAAEIVARLRIHVCACPLQVVGTPADAPNPDRKFAIDAISVGHYIGVQPVFAELALDEAISGALDESQRPAPGSSEDEFSDYRDKLLFTQFTQRGIVRGELGRPFFLPDPRDTSRLAVIAGMGSVGRFGSSELTVLARELFWSLGRLRRKHLATILIGSGSGNIETAVAVQSWLRGAALAILNSSDEWHLEELTIVDREPAKCEEIRQAILNFRPRLRQHGLEIEVFPEQPIPIPETPAAPHKPATPDGHGQRQIATRVLVELDRNAYRFSAVSMDASFPERFVRIDPKLVNSVNNSLAAQQTPEQKAEWGEFLLKLLVPGDIQPTLATDAPIVLACDSNVAQLHWEMMVAPGSAASLGLETSFLGLFPGITRQLRNTFGGPPEPPPPSNRVLRVLIVADTDFKRPLPGAAAEGARVRDLFATYADNLKQAGSKMRIELEALIGPNDATCAQVLKRMLRYPPYDILHYSGHCEYVKDDPPSSGWLFGDGLRLSANELSRVDRVPAFVFSNACESGVTPSRPDLRTPQLAPSFAEAFFERGVKNFVCTAWPVADDSATKFACTFYETLLGVQSGRASYMHEAMTTARKEIWKDGTGIQTWGAYQHYGNPWFKLF